MRAGAIACSSQTWRARGWRGSIWIRSNSPSRDATRNSLRTPAVNPLLDPRICQRMVEEFHAARGVDWSYGGYLEDRRHLWRGSYLEAKGAFVHLGVDFNVPQGTRVAVVEDSVVMLVDDDGDFDGGWGPRVFLKPQAKRRMEIVQIFAHLQAVRVKPGDRLTPGTAVRRSWRSPAQRKLASAPPYSGRPGTLFQEILLERFSELDGYGHQGREGNPAPPVPGSPAPHAPGLLEAPPPRSPCAPALTRNDDHRASSCSPDRPGFPPCARRLALLPGSLRTSVGCQLSGKDRLVHLPSPTYLAPWSSGRPHISLPRP